MFNTYRITKMYVSKLCIYFHTKVKICCQTPSQPRPFLIGWSGQPPKIKTYHSDSLNFLVRIINGCCLEPKTNCREPLILLLSARKDDKLSKSFHSKATFSFKLLTLHTSVTRLMRFGQMLFKTLGL